jgi:hypothetical protein
MPAIHSAHRRRASHAGMLSSPPHRLHVFHASHSACTPISNALCIVSSQLGYEVPATSQPDDPPTTQIEGGEAIIFPKGMAFKVKTDGREIATTIHWLNVSSRPVTSEVVYDFFTMPDSELKQEIVPFVSENEAFSVAPHTKGMVATTCDLLHDAKIVSIMPHAHKRTTAFDVELVAADGTATPIFHDGAFDPGSDIAVYDDPISTAGFARIHHVCTVDNDLNRPIVWGIGDDEMCTLFGYLYPPDAQQLGFVTGDPNPDGSSPDCLTLDLGATRK